MNIHCHIPKSFHTSIVKVNKFVPPTIVRTNPMKVEFLTFTRGQHAQIKIYPYPKSDAGYIVCVVMSPTTTDTRWLKRDPSPKQIIISRRDDTGDFVCDMFPKPPSTVSETWID